MCFKLLLDILNNNNKELKMKKVWLVVAFVLVFTTILSACGPKADAVGEVLVTISGKITEKNDGDTYVLDQAAFDARSVELTYNDPYMGNGLRYKGILLKDLAILVGANDATTISVLSSDGMSVNISMGDAQNWDIMLARWVDGVPLNVDNGGPVKLVFPDDAEGTYTDADWAWWVVRVDFK